MSALMQAAKYADPAFEDHVSRFPARAHAMLARFTDLDELDQAVVVLALAYLAPSFVGWAMDQVNEAPCFVAGCGRPRHPGFSCEAVAEL